LVPAAPDAGWRFKPGWERKELQASGLGIANVVSTKVFAAGLYLCPMIRHLPICTEIRMLIADPQADVPTCSLSSWLWVQDFTMELAVLRLLVSCKYTPRPSACRNVNSRMHHNKGDRAAVLQKAPWDRLYAHSNICHARHVLCSESNVHPHLVATVCTRHRGPVLVVAAVDDAQETGHAVAEVRLGGLACLPHLVAWTPYTLAGAVLTAPAAMSCCSGMASVAALAGASLHSTSCPLVTAHMQ
jgi:hypothetical protein